MTIPRSIQEARAALQSSYAKPADYWRQFIGGGWIACKNPGAAINLRQRMYRARKYMQMAEGATPYDDMIIKLAKGDNRLRIEVRDEGVIELKPDNPNQDVIEDEEIVGIARRERIQKQLNKQDGICERCHNLLALGQHGEGKCETGRAPITPEDLI